MTTAIPMTAKPRKPITRSISLLAPLDADGKNAIVRITVANRSDEYIVDRVPSDFGTAFTLERWDTSDAKKEPVYHVCLDGARSTCDCLGHGYTHGCKHVDGLLSLVKAGKL